MNQKLNEKLIARYEELKRAGVIKLQRDVAEKLGFKEPVVSSYLNGKVKASRNFMDKFEEVFKIESPPDTLEQPIRLTGENRFAYLRYPGKINMTDVKIIQNAVDGLVLSVSGEPAPVVTPEDLKKKERQN